jgi:hypothetical protein
MARLNQLMPKQTKKRITPLQTSPDGWQVITRSKAVEMLDIWAVLSATSNCCNIIQIKLPHGFLEIESIIEERTPSFVFRFKPDPTYNPDAA